MIPQALFDSLVLQRSTGLTNFHVVNPAVVALVNFLTVLNNFFLESVLRLAALKMLA